jgi:hypothetical protein
VQQEQVDGRRDAAAAIGDHVLVLRDALRREFGFGLGERDEVVWSGIDQRCRRER